MDKIADNKSLEEAVKELYSYLGFEEDIADPSEFSVEKMDIYSAAAQYSIILKYKASLGTEYNTDAWLNALPSFRDTEKLIQFAVINSIYNGIESKFEKAHELVEQIKRVKNYYVVKIINNKKHYLQPNTYFRFERFADIAVRFAKGSLTTFMDEEVGERYKNEEKYVALSNALNPNAKHF
jgi:hypothetical protein